MAIAIMKKCDRAVPVIGKIIFICIFCTCPLVKKYHKFNVAGGYGLGILGADITP